ncbi:hypothetical protein HMPREF9163_01269 [Selenomonas sp. oral taxon 138 str. F0429]|nr:hypothetical protein HMPREF9163_01269 [Selenomonas sp. oral taxon 138 str. F0429]
MALFTRISHFIGLRQDLLEPLALLFEDMRLIFIQFSKQPISS